MLFSCLKDMNFPTFRHITVVLMFWPFNTAFIQTNQLCLLLRGFILIEYVLGLNKVIFEFTFGLKCHLNTNIVSKKP